jgi:hypothetical protein
MKRQDVPFQRHWLYYLVLKYAVIALALRCSPPIGFTSGDKNGARNFSWHANPSHRHRCDRDCGRGRARFKFLSLVS